MTRPFAVLVVVLALAVSPLHAQICNPIASVSYTGNGCSGGTLAASPTGFCATSDDVTFTITTKSPVQGCERFTWMFGDNTPAVTSSSLVMTHRYSQAGAYHPVVSDGFGRSFLLNAGIGKFSVTPTGPIEEGAVAQIEVTRSSGNGAASVQYSVTAQVGVAGRDFTPVSGTLSFADGQTSKTIAVQTIHNNLHTDGPVVFRVTLDHASEGWFGSAALITETELDPPATIGFAQASYSATEGAPLSVTLKRDGDLLNQLFLLFSSEGNHFTNLPPSSIRFDPNETSKTITLNPIDDDINRGTQTVPLYIVPLTEFTDQPGSATVSISDNDASIDVSLDGDVRVPEGDGIDTHAALTARLARAASADLSVDWRATPIGGSCCLADMTGYVMFPAGSTSAPLGVRWFANTVYGPDQRYWITITASNVATHAVPGHEQAQLTVENDDGTITPSAQVVVARNASATFRVDLPHAAGAAAALTLAAVDPTVIGVPASVPIDANASSVTFNVQGLKKGFTSVRAVLPPAFGTNKSVEGFVRVIDPAVLSANIASQFPPMAVNDARELVLVNSADPSEPIPVTVTADDPAAVSMPSTLQTNARFQASLRQKKNVTLTFTAAAQYGGGTATVQLTPDDHPLPIPMKFSPSFGPTSGKTDVRVDGTGFVAPCTLTFGSAPATDVAILSPAVLTATTPAGAAGKLNPSIKCGSIAGPFAGSFTYQSDAPAPRVDPNSGGAGGGSLVRVTAPGASSGCKVTFGGAAARAVIPETPATALALTPPHAEGSVDVVVTCPAATVTMPAAFLYQHSEPLPAMTEISSAFGVPGQTISILGTHFRLDDVISFGPAQATIVATKPDEHVVVVPDAAPALLPITVTNKGFTGTLGGASFTLLAPLPPHIDSLTPASGPAGTEIVVRGSGFRPSSTFTIGDKPATLLSVDFGRAIIRIPSALAPGSYLINMLTVTSSPFVVTADGPAISGVLPGCALTTGGTQIVINGSGFAAGATVTVNDVAATNITVVDTSTIRATLPAGMAGDARIVVMNPNGLAASSRDGLRLVSPYDNDGGCAARPRPHR